MGPGLGQTPGVLAQDHLCVRQNKASGPRRASCRPSEAEFAIRSHGTPEKVVPLSKDQKQQRCGISLSHKREHI